jgi:signal-transduction protein with cAMP-binding, CBS, and nucleotidyltransferase domain
MPRLCPATEQLYRALARMRREGTAALAVVDGDARPLGVLHVEDALAMPIAEALGALATATSWKGPAEMTAAKSAQAALADALLRAGEPVMPVLEVISTLNGELMGAVLRRSLATMAGDGWGDPPVPFAAIVMGSGGRRESLLRPDQDHGFILADYPDAEHGRIDAFFVELAERMTRALEGVGFPRCHGHVMAVNPLWRKTLPQWCEQVSLWTRSRSNNAILLSDIFFDFRAIFGAVELADALRDHVTRTAREAAGFLAQMSWRKAEQATAIDLFGRLVAHDGDAKDAFDLKLHGTMPFTNVIRLLALKNGIAATGTLERLARLAEAGVFAAEDAGSRRAEFEFMMALLLRAQIGQIAAHHPVTTLIDPRALSEAERGRVVKAVRELDRLSNRPLRDGGVPLS